MMNKTYGEETNYRLEIKSDILKFKITFQVN